MCSQDLIYSREERNDKKQRERESPWSKFLQTGDQWMCPAQSPDTTRTNTAQFQGFSTDIAIRETEGVHDPAPQILR